jgi:predicted helicase
LRIAGENFKDDSLSPDIKWTQDLKRFLRQNIEIEFVERDIRKALYRPFFKSQLYLNKYVNWSHYRIPNIFPNTNSKNQYISFTGPGSEKPFLCVAGDEPPDLHLTGAGTGAECLPLYRYDAHGNRIDNITDWGLKHFQTHYSQSEITKQTIFHYAYAVLHHPAYREKYKLNLKREFPRIPFYADFWQWATWGEQLMALHLHYETVDPAPLQRHDRDPDTNRTAYKAKLSANKKTGVITLDTITTLTGVPPIAWEYKLGNRSALEWILDRYKERKPRDPTIREKFNTYKFIDYKEQVIELLTRVTTVSVETMQIVNAMPPTVAHMG